MTAFFLAMWIDNSRTYKLKPYVMRIPFKKCEAINVSAGQLLRN